MRPGVTALFAAIGASLRTRAELQAKILALRHQVAVLQQAAPRRLRLSRATDFSVCYCRESGGAGEKPSRSCNPPPSSRGIADSLRGTGNGVQLIPGLVAQDRRRYSRADPDDASGESVCGARRVSAANFRSWASRSARPRLPNILGAAQRRRSRPGSRFRGRLCRNVGPVHPVRHGWCGGIATGCAAAGVGGRNGDPKGDHRSTRISARSFERWRRRIPYGAHRGFMASCGHSALASPSARCRVRFHGTIVHPQT
jgi:hypothetical protein